MEIEQKPFDTREAEKVELDVFIKEMISLINERFNKLEAEISKLKTEISTCAKRYEVNDLQTDIREIRGDILSLKIVPKPVVSTSTLESLKK